MSKDIEDIAKLFGASVVGEIPDVGGGAFAAAHLAQFYVNRMRQIQQSRQERLSHQEAPPGRSITLSNDSVECLGTLGHLLRIAAEDVPLDRSAAAVIERIGAFTLEEIERADWTPDASVGMDRRGETVIQQVLRRLIRSRRAGA